MGRSYTPSIPADNPLPPALYPAVERRTGFLELTPRYKLIAVQAVEKTYVHIGCRTMNRNRGRC